MVPAYVLLVDSDSFSARRLLRVLEDEGHTVVRVETGLDAARLLVEQDVGALLLAADRFDPHLHAALLGPEDPDRGGPVLILLDDLGSSTDCPADLVDRAHETVQRPASDAHVLEVVRAGLAQRALTDENARLKERDEGFSGIVSQDPRMRRIFHTIEAVADSGATLLIQGESGTGKTVLARAAHERSAAPDAPFVVVNCGALPGNLLESELFGHARGAFTGAVKDRAGKFEAADGGTIFLDEIGTASRDLQVKLLRVIEEGTFERVGDSTTRHVDVRVIAATNVDLAKEVQAGNFRDDLYYRLHVVPLLVPPLRERPGDVALLAERFLRRFATRHGRNVTALSPEALGRICTHAWPGNVRELENTIERAVLLARGESLTSHDLWPEVVPESPTPGTGAPRLEDLPVGPLKEALAIPERWIVERALLMADGSRKEAARILGINRTTLFNKMRKYGLFSSTEDGVQPDAPETHSLPRASADAAETDGDPLDRAG